MGSGLGWRIGGVIGTLLVALFFMVPNLVQPLPSWWTAPLPTEGIHLGLDLQGGIHLVLEVDDDKAVENSVQLLGEQVKRELREEEIATRNWRTEGLDGLSFELVSRSRAEDAKEYFAENYPNLVYDSDDGRRFSYKLHELEAANIRELAIDQALETIRNRVDEFGVAEPTIQRTGINGVLVQLPGVQDMAEAKKMMESPEFKKQMKKLEGSKEFKESTKKAREAMKDPATAARMEAQMEHMLTKGQDQLKNNAKNQMAEAMQAMNNPDVMAQAAKMMADPDFQKNMAKMAQDPAFKNYMSAMQDMMKDPEAKKRMERMSEQLKSAM